MVIEKDKVISESELTKRVTEVVKGALLSDVLKDAEDYKKYNAITGTTLDEEAYNKLLEEAPNYLYQLIPEGLKTYPINSEDSDLGSDEDDSLDSSESKSPESNESNLLSSDEDNSLDPDENDLLISDESDLLSSDESNLPDSVSENDKEDTDLGDINSEVEPILQS